MTAMSDSAVFLDRDGTLIEEVGYLDRPDRVELYPWSVDAIRALNRAGLRTVLVSNQSGVARGFFSEEIVQKVHDRIAELALSLARDGVRPVLIGGASDVVLEKFPGADPINLIGRTDLQTLAGVLLQCRALVSNDSGAMHFAAALGVHVVAVFGPTDERVTRPIARQGTSAVILTHEVWCRPCLHRECPLTHSCMLGISVATVLAAVRGR